MEIEKRVTLVPSLQRFWKRNLRGTIKQYIDVFEFDRTSFFFLGRRKEHTEQFKVRMHSPGDVIPVENKVVNPVSLAQSRGMLWMAGDNGIHYLDVGEDVLPRSP